MQVRYRDEFRRAWMFPRNIRLIPPWKIMQIMILLAQTTSGRRWSGNKIAQRQFTKGLEGLDLKAKGDQRDANSGGARTYVAQLECLGLVFARESDGTVWPTVAGQSLLKEQRPLEVMQTQLLRHQYPSAYSLAAQVRMDPTIKVRPFLFLLDLIQDPDLGGLGAKEFAVAVVYGHSHSSYDLCKEKILAWRQIGGDGMSVVDAPAQDLVTPATRVKRLASGDWKAAWKDMKDVGNTFKNALFSNNLIVLDEESNRFVVAPEAEPLVVRESQRRGQFLKVEGKETFQRAYGRFDREKDTRRLTLPEDQPAADGNSVILAKFLSLCRVSRVTDEVDAWVESTHRELGFSPSQIRTAVQPYLDRAVTIFEQAYLDRSRGGAVAGLDFERSTAEIFRSALAFEVNETGQKKRPSGIGGYADLLLLPLEAGKCAVIDTKASGRYALDSSDYHKMAGNYVKNYHELAKDRELEFCGYVAGGFVPRIGARLGELQRETGVPAAAITAEELLNLARKSPGPEAQTLVRSLFRRGGLITSE